MKSVYLLGIMLILVFVLGTYQSFSMSNLYDTEYDYDNAKQETNNPVKYSNLPAEPGQLRVHSQPDGRADATADACPENKSSVQLYDEDQYVYNKGFVNELMYKPETNGTVPYAPAMIQNNMPLNPGVCTFSTDLPIANINVNYFLDKNTTRLK
jgi:hypothetical protein